MFEGIRDWHPAAAAIFWGLVALALAFVCGAGWVGYNIMTATQDIGDEVSAAMTEIAALTGTPAPTETPEPTRTPRPTAQPTAEPTTVVAPTSEPTAVPTTAPTARPSDELPAELAALPIDDGPQLWDNEAHDWDYVFRTAVSSPGQPARYQVHFTRDFENVTVLKMSVDDELVAAYLIGPDGVRTDVTEHFEVGEVPTGDAELDAVLTSRFLNVVDGEILPHLLKPVYLDDVLAGTRLEIFVKDDADLAVNRGLGMVMYFNTTPEDLPGGNSFVVDINGDPVSTAQ